MSIENVSVDDYLDIIGLRKKGSRGRLSEDCKEAVEMAIKTGMTFRDWDNVNRSIIREKRQPSAKPRKKKSTEEMRAAAPEKPQVVRGANAIRIIDQDGAETIMDVHYKCGKAISYCRCRVVDAPPYYGEAKVELIQI